MGFLGNMFSAAVKTVVTPVAIVGDIVDAAQGKEPNNTKNLLSSAINDVDEAFDDLGDADIL
jgi:hypothetical protein